MKKLIPILIAIPIAVIVIAADTVTIPVTKTAGSTTSATSKTIDGYIDTIKIDITGVTTSSVSVKVDGELVYTNAAVTADVIVRPRVTSVDTLGANTNVATRVLCAMDKIVVSCTESGPASGTHYVTVKIDDK